MKLLIVDDSKDITDVLTVYCESKGVECTVVNAGIDGLKIIRNFKRQRWDSCIFGPSCSLGCKRLL
jgi:DNA-binding response OmpR family regulator